MWAKASPTRFHSTSLPTQASSKPVTSKRSSLFTDDQLLFPRLAAELVKPGVPLFQKIDPQPIAPRRSHRWHDDGQVGLFSGLHDLVEKRAAALERAARRRMMNLKRQMHAGPADRPEIPRLAAHVAERQPIAERLS